MRNIVIAAILTVSASLPTGVSATECADNRPKADFNGDGQISIGDIRMSSDQRGPNYTLKHVVPYFGLLVCKD